MKQDEIDYIKNIGQENSIHALNKPYSDERCGLYLIDLGSIIYLLPPPPARLLDMGCGTGWTSVLYAKRGYIVDGQDISKDMIDLANRNKNSEDLSNLNFIESDYESFRCQDKYDCVIFYDSLHHAENEKAALETAYRCLKENGIAITLEPGEGHSVALSSVEALTKYGVTEKDMPPHHIIKIGQEIGFKNFKVFSRYSVNGVSQLFDSEIGDNRKGIFQFILKTGRMIFSSTKKAFKQYKRLPDYLKQTNIVVLKK